MLPLSSWPLLSHILQSSQLLATALVFNNTIAAPQPTTQAPRLFLTAVPGPANESYNEMAAAASPLNLTDMSFDRAGPLRLGAALPAAPPREVSTLTSEGPLEGGHMAAAPHRNLSSSNETASMETTTLGGTFLGIT